MNKKVALVTGSAKGIGKACIIELAKNGYNVVITYLNSKDLALKLKKEVESKYNINAFAFKCDITKEKDIINLINEIIKKFNKIDIIINNAAYCKDNYIEDKTKEEFMKVLETNLVGPFLICKYTKKYINKGVIVNISSKDAETTYNEISMDYCSSKAGLNLLTKTLALAMPSTKIIAVMPGWVETESVKEMNPDFLRKELKRIKQEKLTSPLKIANQIINIIQNEKIISGSIVSLED